MHETDEILSLCVHLLISKIKWTVLRKNEISAIRSLKIMLIIAHLIFVNDMQASWRKFFPYHKWNDGALKSYLFIQTLGVVDFGFDPSSVGAIFYSLSIRFVQFSQSSLIYFPSSQTGKPDLNYVRTLDRYCVDVDGNNSNN